MWRLAREFGVRIDLGAVVERMPAEMPTRSASETISAPKTRQAVLRGEVGI
jgi:hypothetical protein